jgi:argininosuccinate lyase
MLSNIHIAKDILNDEKYKYLFSVEEVNKLVLSGVPFRDAYRKVGLEIEKGNYDPERNVKHTHEGSIGNLCLPEISSALDAIIKKFQFEKAESAIAELLGN